MNKAGQIGIVTAYYLAWLCIVTVLVCLVLCLPFLLYPSTRIDDDIVYLAGIPIGLALFFPVARKLIRVRPLHWCNILAGILGIAVSVPLAVHMFRKSEALTGVTGPLAGMGETVTGFIMIFAGLFFVVVTIAGVTGLKMIGPTNHSSGTREPAAGSLDAQ
ncbi:MAG: hypothetical protein MUC65_07815 [Pontiellaceae bacterium]|jgi:hypothetical protein|nr:hypothetical protein [Pontiellaceae bacterium]